MGYCSIVLLFSAILGIANGLYSKPIFQHFFNAVNKTYPSLKNLKILEFGNQFAVDKIYTLPVVIYTPFDQFGYRSEHNNAMKYFFEHIGMKYTSLDTLEREASLPLNITNPDGFPELASMKYDIITSIGTAENIGMGCGEENFVLQLYHLFKNIHDTAAVDTLMLHSVPVNDSEDRIFTFNEDFFRRLMTAAQYQLEYLDWFDSVYNGSRYLFIGLKKQYSNSKFPTFQEFQYFKGLTINKEHKKVRKLDVSFQGVNVDLAFDITTIPLAIVSRDVCTLFKENGYVVGDIEDCKKKLHINLGNTAGVYY